MTNGRRGILAQLLRGRAVRGVEIRPMSFVKHWVCILRRYQQIMFVDECVIDGAKVISGRVKSLTDLYEIENCMFVLYVYVYS